MAEQRYDNITWTFGKKSSDAEDAFHQLEKAEALRQQGEFNRALTLCQPLVALHPDYYGALYTLGLIYADRKEYPQALGCLVRAVMINPRSWKALVSLSAVYLELGASEIAAQTLEQARLINPNDPVIFSTLGEIYRTEREYELARDAYRKAFDLDETIEIAGIGLGMCCMHLGDYAEAAAIFERLVRSGNRSLIALTALAELPSSLVQVDVLTELGKVSADKGVDKDEFENAAAIVKAAALDGAGQSEEAWQCLAAANRAIFLTKRYDASEVRQTQRDNLANLKARRINTPPSSSTGAISLFILGPSRSGKTTMETLMASLPGVKRGYENPIVETAVRRTFQSAGLLTHKAFDALPPKLNSECEKNYFEELARRAGSAKVFTNTHPVRIYDAARIAATFPDVRFIFIKRDIEDNLLRMFMRRYAVGNFYSYDLKVAYEHIVWYNEMIDVLAGKVPDIARVLRYEDIIDDPRAVLQIGADLCGLDATGISLPELGDDRGCSKPYRAHIAETLEHAGEIARG